jgi:hypothetical protein
MGYGCTLTCNDWLHLRRCLRGPCTADPDTRPKKESRRRAECGAETNPRGLLQELERRLPDQNGACFDVDALMLKGHVQRPLSVLPCHCRRPLTKGWAPLNESPHQPIHLPSILCHLSHLQDTPPFDTLSPQSPASHPHNCLPATDLYGSACS